MPMPAPEAAAQPPAARAAEPAVPLETPDVLQIPAQVAATAPTPELSDMARRLEEALKRPFAAVPPAAKTPPVSPEPRPAPLIPGGPMASAAPLLRQEARVEVRPAADVAAEPKAPVPEPPPAAPAPAERPVPKAGLDMADFDSLEAEMSRLLGRDTTREKV